jgi:hypothetical protein
MAHVSRAAASWIIVLNGSCCTPAAGLSHLFDTAVQPQTDPAGAGRNRSGKRVTAMPEQLDKDLVVGDS